MSVPSSVRTEYAKEIIMNNGTNSILYNTNIFHLIRHQLLQGPHFLL